MRTPSHTTRRPAWIFRLAAVCLVLLIASPFTAPFATCDIADAALHTGIDGTDSLSAKVAADNAVAVLPIVATPMLAQCEAAVSLTADGAVNTPGPSLFALRL